VWDAQTRNIIRTLEVPEASTELIAISPDGKTLATATHLGKTILLWDVASGEQIVQLSASCVIDLEFSPVEDTLAVADGYTVSLWDVATGGRLGVLRSQERSIVSVAFTPDGQTLASVEADGRVLLWHVATRQELCQLLSHDRRLRHAHFRSPDELVILTEIEERDGQGVHEVIVISKPGSVPNAPARNDSIAVDPP
jgi:WD40 repeat protein